MTSLLALLSWSLRRSRIGLGALLFGLAAFEAIQPVALKSFGDLDRIAPLLGIVPPSFWALLNVTPDFLTASGLSGYLSLGYTHPVYIILLSTAVIWFVGRGLAGEMERGTIQYALSRRVSRPRFYLSRVLGLLVVATLTAVIGPLGMLIGMAIGRPEGSLDLGNLALTGIAAWLLAWAVGGAAMFGSAAANAMSKAIGWAIGALVISYVIDYFASLWQVLKPIQPISVFHYYAPAESLALGSLPLQHVIVLGLVGLAGVIGGLIIFDRRDLPV